MKKKIIIGIMFFVVILSIGMALTNALYISEDNGEAELTVAAPRIRLVNQTTNVEKLDLETYTNEFKVVNFDENGNFSDVELNYTLDFDLSDNDAPIDIKLYKIDENGAEQKIDLNSNLETISNYDLKSATRQEDTYKLKIKYNLESAQMDENLDLKINLKSIQAK